MIVMMTVITSLTALVISPYEQFYYDIYFAVQHMHDYNIIFIFYDYESGRGLWVTEPIIKLGFYRLLITSKEPSLTFAETGRRRCITASETAGQCNFCPTTDSDGVNATDHTDSSLSQKQRGKRAMAKYCRHY